MIQIQRFPIVRFVVTAVFLFAGCTDGGIVPEQYSTGETHASPFASKKFGRMDGTASIPFNASFLSNGSVGPDASCAAPYFLLNAQDGDGESTQLGGQLEPGA